MPAAATRLATDGFILLENCLDVIECMEWSHRVENAIEHSSSPGPLQTSVEQTQKTYGSRNLLAICPQVTELLKFPLIQSTLRDILGNRFGIVRGLYFDKPPGATWSLPWHQDLTIAVDRHVTSTNETTSSSSAEEFTKPTIKAGICHVEAPTWLLEQMLTVRIHLDAMQAHNGPVVVRKGSHTTGKLAQQGERPSYDEILKILCSAGTAMLMRPLLSHASIACHPGCEEHRRTVHLELSTVEFLPSGYRWNSFIQVC